MIHRATVDEILVGGPVAPWQRFGLGVGEDRFAAVGGVRLRFADDDRAGITGWTLRDLRTTELDGLPTGRSAAAPPPPRPCPAEHPLGARAVDHVVAVTADLARTAAALGRAGLDERRRTDSMAFFAVGPALLELVQRPGADPPSLWGLVLVVDELDRPREHVGAARDAVQPGRRIATVRPGAGLGTAVALMTPRH